MSNRLCTCSGLDDGCTGVYKCVQVCTGVYVPAVVLMIGCISSGYLVTRWVTSRMHSGMPRRLHSAFRLHFYNIIISWIIPALRAVLSSSKMLYISRLDIYNIFGPARVHGPPSHWHLHNNRCSHISRTRPNTMTAQNAWQRWELNETSPCT